MTIFLNTWVLVWIIGACIMWIVLIAIEKADGDVPLVPLIIMYSILWFLYIPAIMFGVFIAAVSKK